MKRISFAVCLTAFSVVTSLPAAATDADGDGFGKLPSVKGGKASPLLIRIVKYQGNTNGAITVDVRNPTNEPQEFSAKGVYFVPESNANEAPQRLGAVGPFLLHGAGKQERREQMTVAPGATERLSLDVYCIDSHRASPSSATSFRVAKDRVPPELTRAINADAEHAAKAYGGVSAAPAKAAVQSEVWKNRDKKWIQLDGEGRQESEKQR
ncbi:MAG TPA: hypothetical protein VFH73_12760 [Polyangia bacterium]|jgi:hypothetical protein|nr:hypothetical protein [Polyangia bacterium]